MRQAASQYDERWWESNDPVIVAMYQLYEPILMVDFDVFHGGLEKLLGRPVFTHELGMNVEELKKEARLGMERVSKGVETSEAYKAEAVRKSFAMLKEYCKRTGKKFYVVDSTPEASDRNKNGTDVSGYDGWLNPPQ